MLSRLIGHKSDIRVTADDEAADLALFNENVERAQEYEKQRDYSSALKLFEVSLRLFPGDVAVHISFARCLLLLGKIQRALTEYEVVATTHPDSISARLGYARCLQKLGLLHKAIEETRKALAADPDHVFCAHMIHSREAGERCRYFDHSAYVPFCHLACVLFSENHWH